MEFAGALGLALLLGLRHGLDWDHVAALTDITSEGSGSRRDRIKLSLWYAIGHETVICLLGFGIILFAWNVPIWADHIMGKVIGLTLIFMAILMLINRKEGKARLSRGALLLQKFGNRRGQPLSFTRGNVFAIGTIHGIGAETPTQLLLFTQIAGMTAKNYGIAAVAVFSLGLLITHLLIAVAGIWTHDWSRRFRPRIPITVYLASLLSFYLGFTYLF